jgi:hypothetical protein
MNRKPKRNPKKVPGDHYPVTSYEQAIRKACIKLHQDREKDLPEDQKTKPPTWHPHQLRHTAAKLMKRAMGLDAARAALGQRVVNVTEHYAGLDLAKAEEVALKLIRVAAPEGLLLTKLLAFRPQDQLDIESLLTANAGRLDLAFIRAEWQTVAVPDSRSLHHLPRPSRDRERSSTASSILSWAGHGEQSF